MTQNIKELCSNIEQYSALPACKAACSCERVRLPLEWANVSLTTVLLFLCSLSNGGRRLTVFRSLPCAVLGLQFCWPLSFVVGAISGEQSGVIFGFLAMKALILKKLRAPSATLQDVTRCASLVLLCQLLWQKSASCFTPVSLWGLDERFSRALPRFATYYYYWRSSFSK